MSAAAALIRTLRPRQWLKNVFVATPLVFARHLTEPPYVVRTALAVFAFCILSGAVYTFNDVRDVEADRLHPTKRRRPIAAGELTERAALVWSGVLASTALATCYLLDWRCGVIATIYFAQNVAYSVKLKQIAFLDVALIAIGFLLRVLAGAAAIDVRASRWLLLCTALLATFLGLGKRAHELAWAERKGEVGETRAALAGYRMPVVRALMLVIAVATCAAYVAYTLSSHTIEFFHTDRLIFTAPFVALGILRFLFLALWAPKDDPPTEAMLRDPLSLLDLAAAAAAVVYIIYK
jgi:decaprenyl-phosphate phosphoribosyltransferase